MAKFEKLSKVRKSPVWEYFLYRQSTEDGKCTLCEKIISATGGSTKGLMDHLKCKHEQIYQKIQSEKLKKLDQEPAEKRQRTMIKEYLVKKDKMELPERVGRLCAEDLISFRTVAGSKQIQELFTKLGYNGPKNHKSVKNYVMEERQRVKKIFIENFAKLKAKGQRFSCTTDEYTSTGNRRYMNLNVHIAGGDFHSLGLIRIVGSAPAKKMVELFTKRLAEYGLDIKKDIIATTTDGAEVMKKFGKETDPVHFLCYAHALQLCIQKVLYKPNVSRSSLELEDFDDFDSDHDSDGDDEEDGFEFDETVTEEPIETYDNLIKKIRKIVRKFRKSPVKNDSFLQPEILKDLGKNLKLILDCKTRWGSMLAMIKRFLQVHKQLKQAMIMMDETFDITDQDIEKLEHLQAALEPIEQLSIVLGKRDTTLIDSEAIIELTINLLDEQNTDISNELKESLINEVSKRRNTTLVHLIEFLKDPAYVKKRKDFLGEPIIKNDVIQLAKQLLKRLFSVQTESTEETSEDTLDESTETRSRNELSVQERFVLALKKSKAVPEPKTQEIGNALVKKEISLFEEKGERPHYLELLYQALLTIPPTSVESERAFSSTGLFVTKIRSSLGDNTIDALVFLRNYYKRE